MTRIVVDQNHLRGHRRAAIAAAFAIGVVPLAACEPAQDDKPVAAAAPASWDQGLGQAREGQMVQGRENCIKALTDEGKTRAEANEICDDLARQARAQAPATSGTTNSGGGSSDALLWFLIGRSMAPSAYYGAPGGGYTYAGQYASGSYANAAPAPRTITPTQGDILKTAPQSQARTSVVSRAGFGGGVTAGRAGSSSAVSMGATSRGGMSVGGGSRGG